MESLVFFAALLLFTVVLVCTPSLIFALRPPRRTFTRVLCFLFALPSLAGGILLLCLNGPFRLIGVGYIVASPVSVIRTVRSRRPATSLPSRRSRTERLDLTTPD